MGCGRRGSDSSHFDISTCYGTCERHTFWWRGERANSEVIISASLAHHLFVCAATEPKNGILKRADCFFVVHYEELRINSLD